MLETSNRKGAAAEAAIAAAAAKLGVDVYWPMGAHGRYDLIFDLGARFLRVQCKWARRQEDVVVVSLTTHRFNSRGERLTTTYGADEVDAIAAYCGELDRCYLIPIELAAGMHALTLRLAPPRNGQRAWLNWATDFDLPGAIAQLGERRAGSAKVGGSNPPSSIPSIATVSSPGEAGVEHVGAHDLRERLGWYLQRVGAGERFLITRRGKPWGRLEPCT